VGPAAAVSPSDAAAVGRQLGREPRSLLRVAHRCGCGLPDVVTTAPRLPDGTPFPTLYYLTCPRARAAVGRLETTGVMRTMTDRLATDAVFAAGYAAAAHSYRRQREATARDAGVRPLPPDFPLAGGMPDRVKCLHVAVAHALAAGPGVNPVGDEAVAAVTALAPGPRWGGVDSCLAEAP
jgi:hypothetical protein